MLMYSMGRELSLIFINFCDDRRSGRKKNIGRDNKLQEAVLKTNLLS
jgi:hypothetical protein